MTSLEGIYAEALRPCSDAFSATALMARAERATGLGNWGGEQWAEGRFRQRLEVLCRGLEDTACLHELGRSRAHSRLHVLLCSRLRQIEHHGRMEHVPELGAPLVGTGFPRAGTTFLHGLLACDPANRVATAAQSAIPLPVPDGTAEREDERIALYQKILAFQGFTTSDVTAIHPYSAAAPEECVFLQEAACAVPLGAFYYVPEFAALGASAVSVADSFTWQKGMMQSLQGDLPTGRWLLKAPSHIINMDALITAFPGAWIFLNHRDPGKVIPSMGSLYMKLYSLVSEGSVDPKALGQQMVKNWQGYLDRLDAWRETHRHVPVVDVHYTSLISDPIGTAERLYASFGLELSDASHNAMKDHLVVDHHGKGPARAYGLADFGLTEADIEATFGDYIERHGITREKRT